MVAGTIGLITLLLAGIGFQVLPLNFGALGLIILAFCLFLAEFFIPSYGTLTIGGLASLAMGSLFLYSSEDSFIAFSRSIVIPVLIGIGLFVAVMAAFLLREGKRTKNRTDYYSLKGKKGSVVNKLGDNMEGFSLYQIRVSGEVWRAKSGGRLM